MKSRAVPPVARPVSPSPGCFANAGFVCENLDARKDEHEHELAGCEHAEAAEHQANRCERDCDERDRQHELER